MRNFLYLCKPNLGKIYHTNNNIIISVKKLIEK